MPNLIPKVQIVVILFILGLTSELTTVLKKAFGTMCTFCFILEVIIYFFNVNGIIVLVM